MELNREQLEKEIANAVNYFTDKDLLVKYLAIIAERQFINGKEYILNKYEIKLK